ncbi:MAG: septation protein SepH [Actinomycetota bacterium]|nr:septation protein SepH [Actinomycetota bacterium]
MAHLTLAGVSDDGKRLLLVSDKGVEFTLDITPGLRAALNGDTSRLGQLEIQMDSVIRPRDIQARIRAGETPEAVAQAAQTSVDKIMVYAGPVLDERRHVAERAQRSSVRRRGGDTSQVRTLGEAVNAHLRSCNVDPSTVEWDAWRREDGRWTLTAVFNAGAREGTAQLTYDAPGNYAVLDNDDARWLVGEVVATPAPRQDDLQERRRRLSAVPGGDPVNNPEELPLGDDAIELVHTDPPLEAYLDDSPASDDPDLREEAAEAAAADDESGQPEEHEPPARRAVQKKRGRASVPSWDEIMFGGSDQ